MIDEPSDGVFRFYWADHEEMEWARGPFDSVEEAKANAISDFETCHYGADPGATIYIVRCDKRLTRTFDFGSLIETLLEVDFDRAIEEVWDKFGEANEDCFGEDGFEGLTSVEGRPAERAYAALEGSLQMEIIRWRFAGTGDENALADTLSKSFAVWQDLYRDNIRTWTFGRVEDADEFTLPSFGSEQADEDFIQARIAKHLGLTPDAYATLRAGNTTTPTH